LITTKKGKAGARTRFDFNYYKGIVEPMPTLEMMNTQQFIQIRQEALATVFPALAADPVALRAATLAGTPTIPGLNLPGNLTDEEIAALPSYDWQKEAFKTGKIDNYELSMSGGNDVTTFYTSVSYNHQDGSLINIDFDRMTGRVNLAQKITPKLTFETNLNLSSVRQRGPYGDARATTAFGAPQYASPTILPLNPIYDPETGDYYGIPGSGTALVGDLNHNVIANSYFIKSLGRTNQIVGNASLSYNAAKGLLLRAFVGMDYRHLYTEFYGDPRTQDNYAFRGQQTTVNNTNRNLTTNYTANYSGTFGERHNVSALAGFEYRDEVNEGSNFNGTGFPTPDFTTANAAATPVAIGGFWTGFKRVGYFGNLKYDLDKKYFLSLTMRYDGSSRFGANNQFGAFPSVSAAWNIFEENFLKTSNVVSDLRIRASWGTTGNDQIGNFDSRILYGLGGTRNTLNGMNGLYGGVSGIGIAGLGNPDLRWEKNETYNIGIDYGFFNNRVSGSVDVFRRYSKDLLLDMAVPQTSGYNSIRKNVGEVMNEGFEFELRTTNVDAGNFRWETNFNITLLRNEVLSLFDGLPVLPGDQSVRVGYPLFSNVNNPFAGVNPANGRPMHYDINGNITYIRSAADLQPMGHENFSNMYGGFTNTFSYKGIELSAFFQYDYGRTAINFQNFRMADNAAVLRNSRIYYAENRWTTPGQLTDVPRPAYNRTESSARISSYQTTARFYEDASFIRLKQVTLGYNLPTSILSKYRISNVRVYAQAVNLLTWTKWTGYDPEFQETDANRGTEGIIPQTRNYTFGVQVGF
jgi:TonB-linked SusC/RagA family outer membrane protein